ncbi:hypothetical protein ZYGR_0AD00420 [Zygosaccharomyces rouxii]|uniref:HhH-GPD domain-containing protein n=1 Tax=Zygosaccharomyces rouxii TaxID=4956 RepID=A0A1Q3A583_ZYGRO|nr:hypothetical protein ZYGR_0AD00420 [Zygosaccharomyces rouxii]
MKRPLETDGYDENDDEKEISGGIVASVIPDEFLEKHSSEFHKACRHIMRIDKSLVEIILKGDFPLFLKDKREVDFQFYYDKLASAIISQQISGIAAKSIKKRLIDYFGGKFPAFGELHDELVDPIKRQKVQACGFSARKMEYLESLTNYFCEKENSIKDLFANGTDDEIVEQLTKNIKGIGPWSSKMFLLTGLSRMDVFAPDDLGIARGFSKYLSDKPLLVEELKRNRVAAKRSKIKHKKLNWVIYDDDLMEKFAAQFSPYRSVLMFILWRMAATNVEAMANNEKEFISN